MKALAMAIGIIFVAGGSVSIAADEASTATNAEKLYTVVDGNKVDDNTLKGWKTWRALACARCHGANQEGMVGPSLISSMKVLSKEEFDDVMLNGRIKRGMPGYSGSERVVENLDNLYAYLKGRSDGAIDPGRLKPISK
jgi:mono/diheme cytochrome c family protein